MARNRVLFCSHCLGGCWIGSLIQVPDMNTPWDARCPLLVKRGHQQDYYIFTGQIIATSHDLTLNGGLVREIPENFREIPGYFRDIPTKKNPSFAMIFQIHIPSLGGTMSPSYSWSLRFLFDLVLVSTGILGILDSKNATKNGQLMEVWGKCRRFWDVKNSFLYYTSMTRWWFHFLFFHPYLGKIPILTSILFKWVGSTTNQMIFFFFRSEGFC